MLVIGIINIAIRTVAADARETIFHQVALGHTVCGIQALHRLAKIFAHISCIAICRPVWLWFSQRAV